MRMVVNSDFYVDEGLIAYSAVALWIYDKSNCEKWHLKTETAAQ